jgi:hypothetical protein
MTDTQVEPFLGRPATTKLRNGSTFTGRLKANGDGTYSVASGLGSSETQQYVQRFTAAEINSITLL